uniref:Heme O synthase n=1 Tax=Pseudo-nitzschia australis TaxID=44445 RepID=A0A7S4A8V3_9STRA|mmetsp:Transcript_8948/g.19336  ORF Transcript_8948/g.19336 Transcript_8948/m.19336 type:complete len:479 (-) Transcript_8948:32-1468(-)|eukprot:CAMPEP_0168211592 /NCGR_PEP_ID=MMETSP0140_2-20121125/3797_1 /TAXON_ID=44445 /ORGANISM="Pseudo-nitzschia australis, Strain 10249 10 AB" /LENGTH=478 /DNA_ID=CAMNT_0008138293 /DNA_START=202 /DNA_END=1641 /DNA_ORIENTATION=-
MLSIQILRRNAKNHRHVLRLLDQSKRRSVNCELQCCIGAACVPNREVRWFSSHSSSATATIGKNATADCNHRRPLSSTTQELSLRTTVAATINIDDDDSTGTTKTKTTSSKTSAYLQLGKAKLSGLVVTTTLTGFVAAGGPLYEQAPLAASCLVGTTLCSFSAAAMNQIYERDRDAMMKRTQQRPMVTGALTVNEAKLAAAAWGVGGTTLLAVGTDPVTTLLGLTNIGLYAGVYTYMKPRSIYNTWVGAVVGAIPPVMGWTAATSGNLLDLDAVILGSTLYYWQLPHFFALSYMYRLDYERGGFSMLSSHEVDGERTSAVILRNAVYLSAIPFVSTFAGVTSSMFALEGIALNSYALWVAYRFRQERTNANARKVFLTSLWYLPSWLVLFLLHSKVWDEDHDQDVLRDNISEFVHRVRDKGRKMCLHERVLDHHASADRGTAKSDNTCPVALTKKAPAVIQSTASSAIEECETKKDFF